MAVAEDDAIDGFAITASREAGVWRCGVLPPAVLESVESCLRATRQQPGDGGALGLVNISDEFFVVIRATGGGDDVRLLLSDATAALDWDFAADVAQRLDEDVDEESADELWPIGDLGILEDLGLPAGELRMIVDDVDLYADEMLGLIARRLGFAEEFAQALDTLPR
ncbi:MAG: tRNA adenosine deaminase-associated protein [Geodermatophilaceae bacterium]|jgi:putative tRNA adenosine deaminase-associated protein|nr:tRNA adenosine deaminase-associated protein [Geodermatophilaceae bacterium]